jgi:hypothetical protein
MSNILGFKRAQIRKNKLGKLVRKKNFNDNHRIDCSQHIKAVLSREKSVLNWGMLNTIEMEFTINEVHFKNTQDNIVNICNKLETQRLIEDPIFIFILDSAIPFYKDTQDYLIINNKKITLDDLQNKLLVDILKEG